MGDYTLKLYRRNSPRTYPGMLIGEFVIVADDADTAIGRATTDYAAQLWESEMSDCTAEADHRQIVLEYRRELLLAPAGLKRSRLITLIAREKMLAREEGWAPIPD